MAQSMREFSFLLAEYENTKVLFSSSLYFDFALTTFILVLCMAAIAYPTIARAVKRKCSRTVLQWIPSQHRQGSSKNKWVLLTVVTLALTCIVPAFFVGLVSGIGFTPMSFTGAIILKGIVCAVVGGLSTYLFTVARLYSTTACVLFPKVSLQLNNSHKEIQTLFSKQGLFVSTI